MRIEKIYLKDEYEFLGADGANPTVDCYLPYNLAKLNRQNDKRPCMVVCPGGAYYICSERESEPIALQFLPLGFNVFVLKYSTTDEHSNIKYPRQLLEVAATFDLIKKNADNWNCDAEKIGIIGFSAGGHLAAHYSTAFDCKEVRDVFGESVRPFASILCYPVITDDKNFANKGSFENLLGYFPDGDEKYSCEKLVNKNTPPAFIWHISDDDCVPIENSLLYAMALKKYNIPFELHAYPHGGHGLATCDALTFNEVKDEYTYAKDWLRSLKNWIEITF